MFEVTTADSDKFYRQLFKKVGLLPNPDDEVFPDEEKIKTSTDVLIDIIKVEWARLQIIKNNTENNAETIKLKLESFYTMLFLKIDNTMQEQNLEYNGGILNEIYKNCFVEIYQHDDDFFKRISRFFIQEIIKKNT